MEEMNDEQIVQLGQMYFPNISPEQILDVFSQFKKMLPEGTSNLEIAQVIKKAIDSGKLSNLSKLKQVIGNR